jgi:hypothetical protein
MLTPLAALPPPVATSSSSSSFSSSKPITPVAGAGAAHAPSSSYSSSARRPPQRRRHTYGSNTPHQRSPLQVIRQAAATQEALDARRQGVEGAIASGRVNNGVVVAALHALLRSVHADRATARQCLKALLFDPADHAATLARAQASQAELLDRAAHALAFAPLVARVDTYLRDRNLPPGTVAFCLDQGAASWLRVRVARVDVPLPPESVAARAFSSCTLEVTKQLPLVAVGSDMYVLWVVDRPVRSIGGSDTGPSCPPCSFSSPSPSHS